MLCNDESTGAYGCMIETCRATSYTTECPRVLDVLSLNGQFLAAQQFHNQAWTFRTDEEREVTRVV